MLRSDNWEGGHISCDRFFQGYGPGQDNAQCWRASETHKERRSFLALQRTRQEEMSIATYGLRYGPGLDEEDEDEEEL